jgi:AraC-like DNA-binding protein
MRDNRPPPLPAAAAHACVSVRSFADLPGVEVWSATRATGRWATYNWAYGFSALDPEPAFHGRLVWTYRRATYCAGRTSTMLLEPDEVYVTTLGSEPASFHTVLVDREVVEHELADSCGGPWPGRRRRHFRSPQLDDPGLHALFHELLRRLLDASVDATERQRHLRRYLTALFARAGSDPVATAPAGAACERAVRRARELIENDYAGALSLDRVARAAGVSKFHLERRFGARVGVPVWEFVKQVRVRRAMTALRAGRRPAEVATAVGFSDQAHMTRVFKELFGFTPGQYRRAYFPATPRPLVDG